MLPVSGPISLADVNVELYNASNSIIDMNSYGVRRLASAGNTGQNLTSGTPISLSTLYGNAHFNRNIGDWIQNPNIINDATASGRYVAGRTWASYTVLSAGVIGSTSRLTPSVIIPSVSGVVFDININSGGYIVGAGGDGGRGEGGGGSPVGLPGNPGGTAILLNGPVIVNNLGIIGGGGGGGGGGNNDGGDAGGGGGGGAGFNTTAIDIFKGTPFIVGGTGGAGPSGAGNGGSGRLEQGGGGGNGENGAPDGGPGGDLGNPGSPGNGGGDLGGAAGVAISGTRFVEYRTQGNILGPTIF